MKILLEIATGLSVLTLTFAALAAALYLTSLQTLEADAPPPSENIAYQDRAPS